VQVYERSVRQNDSAIEFRLGRLKDRMNDWVKLHAAPEEDEIYMIAGLGAVGRCRFCLFWIAANLINHTNALKIL